MQKNKSLIKFAFRFLVVNITFFAVKLTVDHAMYEDSDFLSPTLVFYYTTTFILFMLTWHFNDWLLANYGSKGPLNLKNSLVVIALSMAFLLPLSALLYYLGHYLLKDTFALNCIDTLKCFWIDFVRADIIGFAVIVLNLLYHLIHQGDELKRKMDDLQKEVLASRYTALKNQISPHFLFNSLNTLTSLMYQDRDLASDFVARLANSYRYILENKEVELVSLDKELHFLDSFIFMMNVRHSKAINFNCNIGVAAPNFMVPTLSLQMLVENALKHNFFSSEKPMAINIFTVEDTKLVISNTLRKRHLGQDTTQVGLQNIRNRYAFHTKQEISIEDHSGFYKVTMPLLNKNIINPTALNLTAK